MTRVTHDHIESWDMDIRTLNKDVLGNEWTLTSRELRLVCN